MANFIPCTLTSSFHISLCSYQFQLPAIFALAARNGPDVEEGIAQAVNGYGQNQSRAALVGALCGAQGGFGRLPTAWVAGLENSEATLTAAQKLAAYSD